MATVYQTYINYTSVQSWSHFCHPFHEFILTTKRTNRICNSKKTAYPVRFLSMRQTLPTVKVAQLFNISHIKRKNTNCILPISSFKIFN